MSKYKAIRKHYAHRVGQGLENYRVLDWASAETQRKRFDVLVDHVELAGQSLLDVGCGLGDLKTHLDECGVPVDYTGVDILEEMISAAQARHPDATFVRADPFAQINPLTGPYDVVFCSGTLNLNLGNNRPFLARAVDRFFELAGRFVVFNLLHIRMAEETHRYFYHDPDDVLDMLRPYPGTARLIDDYLPNDFTIVCDLDEPGDGAPLA